MGSYATSVCGLKLWPQAVARLLPRLLRVEEYKPPASRIYFFLVFLCGRKACLMLLARVLRGVRGVLCQARQMR